MPDSKMTLLDLVLWLFPCFGLGCITGMVIHLFVLKRRANDAARGSHHGEKVT